MSGALFAAVAAKVLLGGGIQDATLELVKQMIGVQDEHQALLGRIDRNVEALLQGPFNTGRAWLDKASMPSREPEARHEMLVLARDRFMDARGQEGSNASRAALVEFQLGLTFLALGDWTDAEEHIELAYEAVLRVMSATSVHSQLLHNSIGALEPLLVAIRDVRIAFGALRVTIPGHIIVRFGNAIYIDGTHGGPPAGARFNKLADTKVARECWVSLSLYRTSTLAAVAAGSPVPGPLLKGVSVRCESDAGMREVAGDIVHDRRLNTPIGA